MRPGLRTKTRGQKVTLQCRVSGMPPPRITWYKDGVLLQTSRRVRLKPNRYLILLTYLLSDDSCKCRKLVKNFMHVFVCLRDKFIYLFKYSQSRYRNDTVSGVQKQTILVHQQLSGKTKWRENTWKTQSNKWKTRAIKRKITDQECMKMNKINTYMLQRNKI